MKHRLGPVYGLLFAGSVVLTLAALASSPPDAEQRSARELWMGAAHVPAAATGAHVEVVDPPNAREP